MFARLPTRPGRTGPVGRTILGATLASLLLGTAVPPAAAVTGLELSVPYPAVVVEPGGTATFSLNIDVTTARRVNLATSGLPSGWTARFRGGGLEIDGVYVTPDEPPTVTLDVDVPDDAAASSSTVTVRASSGELSETLALTIRVAETAGGDVTLETDFPELRGPADATYTYNLDLRNDTPGEITFGLAATGPAGWSVEVKPSGQERATTTMVAAGSSTRLTVTVDPSQDVAADTYPVAVEVSGAGRTVSSELTVIITGSYAMTVSTADQVLSTTANAGAAKELDITVTNDGSAPLTEVRVTATTPTNWELSFEPSTIASVAPDETVTVKGQLTPTNEAIAGDYEVTVRANAAEANDSVSIRVRVETPQFWWIVGIVLIGLTFAGLYWVFRTYGRR